VKVTVNELDLARIDVGLFEAPEDFDVEALAMVAG
jgi:hypothetical protein